MTDETLAAPEHQPALPQTKASWRTLLCRLLTTPLGKLFPGRLTRRPDVNSAIAAANLPVELATLIQTVVRATRLWRSERADVARELAGHFRDGLDAGAGAADLKEQFGELPLVARLIRTARIRCRPAWWQAWRYSRLATALVLLMYVGLAVRFFLSAPTIARNYVREFNDQVRAIPEEQRAWPLYRAALKLKQPYPKPANDQPRDFDEGWWDTENNRVDHDSLAWKQLLLFVEQNQASIQQIHEAARRPQRGIIYGDPEDHPENVGGEDRPMYGVLLYQSQEMRTFARLLTADATVATAARDGNRLANDLQSLILVAEQCRGHWLVEDLISAAILEMTMSAIRDSLEVAPDLLTDKQLVEVAHRLAVYYGGGTIRYDLHGEQSLLDDVLQRCYTDDGQGNGSLTPAGLKLLGNLAPVAWKVTGDPQPVLVSKAVLAPAIMLRSMGRRESKEIQDRWFAELQSLQRGPLYTWKGFNPCQDFYMKERSRYTFGGPALVPAYCIPLLFIPAIEQFNMAAEQLCQLRDGTLTAIALELYHRRHGNWPLSLEELVSAYLPESPLDRFTGQALRYRIQNGRPLVYACGMDQQDDGGRHPNLLAGGGLNHQQIFGKPATPQAPGAGYDWVLFPRPRRSPQTRE